MPEEVQSTYQQTPPKETPVQTSHKINWFHIVIGVIAGVILVGMGLGVYLLTQSKSEPTNETTKVSTPSAKQATPSVTAIPSAEKDETADWNVHENKDLGFKIKYPNSWDYIDQTKFETQACDPGPTVGKDLVLFGRENLKCVGVAHFGLWDEKVEFVVYSTKKYNPLKPITGEIYTDLTIDGEKAVKNFLTETSQGPRCTCTRIYVNHKDKGFMIEFVNKDLKGNYDPIYDTLLSTLKFLD